MTIALGPINALQWVSPIFKRVVILDQSINVVKQAPTFDSDNWEVRDYIEIISRISCIAADYFALQSNANAIQVDQLTSNLPATLPFYTLATASHLLAEISTRNPINKYTVLILALRITELYFMNQGILFPCHPVLIGVVFNTSLKILDKVFPQDLDNLPLSAGRHVIRTTFNEYMREQNEKVRRIVRVVIPDNLAYSTALVSAYLTIRKDPLEWADGPILIGMTLTTIAALHFFREQSWIILAPVSRRLPVVGPYLSSFFKSIGPSDL